MSKQLDSKNAENSNKLYTLLCTGFPAVGKSYIVMYCADIFKPKV